MPFLGKDWRAPGETWIRVDHAAGWERVKLRPIQIATCSDSSLGIIVAMPTNVAGIHRMKRHSSSASFSSSDESTATHMPQLGSSPGADSLTTVDDAEESTQPESEDEEWIPHCFVKTNRSKEFIGCTSMSEAFHRLDLARAVADVRRFNYVCKVVQILVTEKLQNLSGTARKHLLSIIQTIVIHSVEKDVDVTTARDLVTKFGYGLEGHVWGSPQLASQQLDTVTSLVDTLVNMIVDHGTKTLPDSCEESMTFLDLPREILAEILRRLPDHVSMLECAKVDESLNALVVHESRLWKSLAKFHFTQEQIDKHKQPGTPWRRVFFTLKRYHGLRETYASLICICCACKALFWKNLGHPCLTPNAPSVRVMPQQFVDMLHSL